MASGDEHAPTLLQAAFPNDAPVRLIIRAGSAGARALPPTRAVSTQNHVDSRSPAWCCTQTSEHASLFPRNHLTPKRRAAKLEAFQKRWLSHCRPAYWQMWRTPGSSPPGPEKMGIAHLRLFRETSRFHLRPSRACERTKHTGIMMSKQPIPLP